MPSIMMNPAYRIFMSFSALLQPWIMKRFITKPRKLPTPKSLNPAGMNMLTVSNMMKLVKKSPSKITLRCPIIMMKKSTAILF